MPYFIHLKTDKIEDLDCNAYCEYHSRASAFDDLKTDTAETAAYLRREIYTVETHTVSFWPSSLELSTWRRRERERFRDGTYLQTPWHDAQIDELVLVHYVHLSIDKPGMVAYTPDVEHGITDKQIRLTPGRYLERFYKDYFNREQIAEYVAAVSAQNFGYSVARTVADVRKVYRNGPPSCMGGCEEHTDEHWKESRLEGHMPAEIYAEPGDLAVAYFGPIEKPAQRSVIWPAKKRYIRIYGTGPLERLLRADGYTDQPRFNRGEYGALEGARVPRIDVHGGYLMAYVDGADQARQDGNFLVFDEDGDLGCQITGGIASERERDRDEDEDDDPQTRRCEHCNEWTDIDELNGGLCGSCVDDSWTCNGCSRTFFDDETQTDIDDDYYCESCTTDRTSTCQDEDCAHTWIESNEFDEHEQAERKRHEMADLCRQCYERYAWCEDCQTSYDGLTCPSCERSPRCDATGDLLTAVVSDVPERTTATHWAIGQYGHCHICDHYGSDCTGKPRPDYTGQIVTNLTAVDGSLLAYATPNTLGEMARDNAPF